MLSMAANLLSIFFGPAQYNQADFSKLIRDFVIEKKRKFTYFGFHIF